MRNNVPLLFSGSSHPALSQAVAHLLEIPLASVALYRFPDGETSVEVLEEVYRRDVFVVQSIVIDPNNYLVELLLLVDALKRGSARTITAIIPYFGYCRQDRRDREGKSISAKMIANLLATAGIQRLITCDLHTGQIEGFFEIPVDHLSCQPLFVEAVSSRFATPPLVLAPDIGSIKRGEKIARALQTDLVVVEKRRLSEQKIEMQLIGSVEGRELLIVDDICSTGTTLLSALSLCIEQGARSIIAAVTHLLTGEAAAQAISASPLTTFLTTDTVPLQQASPPYGRPPFVFLSVAPLIAARISRLVQAD